MGLESLEKPALKLEQSAFLSGKQCFKLTEDNYLAVRIHKFHTIEEYRLSISLFDPNPTRYRKHYYPWLLGTLGLAGLFGISMWNTITSVLVANVIGLAVLSAALALCTVLCLAQFILKSRDFLIFYNRFSGKPLVVFWNNRPDSESFNEFVHDLQRRAKTSIEESDQKMSKSIAAEIRELAKLRQDGVLSPDEFETAKQSILKSIGDKKIAGFGTG